MLTFKSLIHLKKHTTDFKENYIFKIRDISIYHSKRVGLFPSVTMAQSALESNFGKSELSKKYNNYFGIKGINNNRTINIKTFEYENGIKKIKNDYFRIYENVEESFKDYVDLITKSKRYKNIKSAKNYKDAIINIKNNGYSTDPDYDKKVIFLIEKYKLYKYD